MGKFTVLHLSDLHIDKTEDINSKILREAMIDDIIEVKEKNGINIELILTTGDITNRGGNEEAFNIAYTFYLNLIGKVNVKSDNCLFVSGNHDIPREKSYETLLKNYTDQDFESYWKMLQNRYENYNKFNEEFHIKKNENKYGGYIRDFNINDTNIRIIGFNTSWFSIGNEDYEKIKIGRKQLDELAEQLKSMSKSEVVIGMAHHPFNWLNRDERELVNSYINDERRTKVDFILQGHVHDAEIESISTPDSSFVKLISGIGYPENDKRESGHNKLAKCRYAIYRIDTENKTVEAWLRISNNRGEFSAETTLYKIAKENGYFKRSYSSSDKTTTERIDVIDSKIEVDSIPIIKDWIGREDDIRIINEKKYKIVAITGIGGQGKSSLAAEYLKISTRQNKKYEIGIWINCREIPDTLHMKLIKMLEVISGGIEKEILFRDEKIENTINRFIGYLKKYRVLLVFDNVDAYIKKDSEDFDTELKPLMEACLNNQHESLVLITSRLPINDFRSDFLSIKLRGFSKEEGINFFEKRGIKFEGKNTKQFCEKIIELTHGHPLWLGLIAGQVISEKDTIKNIIDEFSFDETSDGGMIKDYFKSIWDTIDKYEQILLRYLSEATRPLLLSEIIQIVLECGPDKVRKHINRLVKRGLLERYEEQLNSLDCYQVHPLVREFIHKTYDSEKQKPFVKKVLLVFLPANMIELLFRGNEFQRTDKKIDVKDVVCSIETCINSRNYIEAFKLLHGYSDILYDEGFHHQFVQLAKQILDNLDWEGANLIKNNSNAKLISIIVEKLIYLGENDKANHYLKRFESIVEYATIPYTGFLSMSANNFWRMGEWEKTMEYIHEAETYQERWEFEDLDYIKALTLRDSGNPEEALKIFEKGEKKSATSGNIARCYQLMGEKEKARDFFIKSIKLLKEETETQRITHLNQTNFGYAFLWVAEYFFECKEYEKSFAFVFLTFEKWKEYAPGLLYKLKDLDLKLVSLGKENKYIIQQDSANNILKEFLEKK